MSLPFFIGFEILREGQKKENEKNMYLRWLIGGYERTISFDKFVHEIRKKGHKPTNLSEEEILEKVKNILGG